MPIPLSLTVQQDIVSGHESEMFPAIGLVKMDIGGFNRQLAAVGMASRALTARLTRIWSIWEGSNLIFQRSFSGWKRRSMSSPISRASVFWVSRNQIVQIHRLGRNDLLSGKSEELTGDVPGVLGRLFDLHHILQEGIAAGQPGFDQFRISENDAEHIVEIMRHAPASCRPSAKWNDHWRPGNGAPA